MKKQFPSLAAQSAVPGFSTSAPGFTPCALACACLLAGPALAAEDETVLRETVVTAVHDSSPAQVVADPRQPRQPVPASDAADYLKSIPGFSAIRSGGSNSDPVFRGQFGSRLPLLTDGSLLLGACPSRMDSPSSYISPQSFDELTVVKGPQTVIWGPGASAGVVRFSHERPDFSESGLHFDASLLGGSAGRNDQSANLQVGNAGYYLRLSANHSHGQDYRDGAGRSVPSGWDKWNTDLALGLTPDADTLIELTAGAGDGWARYGGRGMDGAKFRRDSWGLRLERKNLSPWLAKIEAQIYSNRVDHVMDNYSLREFKPGGGMNMPMASNVWRNTSGARLAATMNLAAQAQLVAGLDALYSPHEKRMGSPMGQSYLDKPWQRDAKSSNLGLFGELSWQTAERTRWVGGLRLDQPRAWRYPEPAMGGGMGGMHGAGMGPMVAEADNQRSRKALPSGFVRWEQQLAQPGASAYAGLGHVQRFPDYWELISPGNSAADKGNAFAWLQPEKTTQIDLGLNWKSQDWQLWTSAYAGWIRDYILFDYQGGSRVRNVNARTAGLELGGHYRLSPAWTTQATLAYGWGRNTSDGRALPQMPPLEARLGLEYESGPWAAGGLWRMVASQKRHAAGQGNVVGRDLGASAGFGLLSVHASYRVNQRFKLAAGVDNLFDKTYAEHLNLAGNAGFGFPAGQRINEPGRTLWLRADIKY
ncbi:TonB-dependent copper receptor [Comamonas composti]|uniref:TonB-dependent copper receptor n=1 Tax=Comamonas composti TaxID=408558 RepID=UPI000417725C|nr:TonB-dependent copper receptor [Comamonas composti]